MIPNPPHKLTEKKYSNLIMACDTSEFPYPLLSSVIIPISTTNSLFLIHNSNILQELKV